MPIQQGATNAFKTGLPSGTYDFATDTFKMALYTGAADIGPTTLSYTATGETSGTGYTAGGQTLTGVTVSTSGLVAYVNFNPVSWSAAITARGALIYNTSKSNKSIAVINFGSDKTSNTTFVITPPANTATSAVIRLP